MKELRFSMEIQQNCRLKVLLKNDVSQIYFSWVLPMFQKHNVLTPLNMSKQTGYQRWEGYLQQGFKFHELGSPKYDWQIHIIDQSMI